MKRSPPAPPSPPPPLSYTYLPVRGVGRPGGAVHAVLDLELGDPVVLVGTALDHHARDLPDLAQVRLDPAGAVWFGQSQEGESTTTRNVLLFCAGLKISFSREVVFYWLRSHTPLV